MKSERVDVLGEKMREMRLSCRLGKYHSEYLERRKSSSFRIWWEVNFLKKWSYFLLQKLFFEIHCQCINWAGSLWEISRSTDPGWGINPKKNLIRFQIKNFFYFQISSRTHFWVVDTNMIPTLLINNSWITIFMNGSFDIIIRKQNWAARVKSILKNADFPNLCHTDWMKVF